MGIRNDNIKQGWKRINLNFFLDFNFFLITKNRLSKADRIFLGCNLFSGFEFVEQILNSFKTK